MTIDATFMSSFGRGMGNKKREAQKPEEKVISEPAATWYIRTYESEDNKAAIRKSGFGWEYEFASVIFNDPAFPRAVPHIVIGFNQHPADTESNPRAREIFEDIIGRGHSIDYAVGDQAYFPGAHAEVPQNYLRENGVKLVMKYAKSQEKREANGEGTIQGEKHGAILVEGQWYCPALPSILRAAVVNYQKALSDDRRNPKLSPPIGSPEPWITKPGSMRRSRNASPGRCDPRSRRMTGATTRCAARPQAPRGPWSAR